MKQPSPEAQKKHFDVKYDRPFEVVLGKSTFHVKYVKSKTSDLIALQIIKICPIEDVSVSAIMKALLVHGKAPAKCISYGILNTPVKIFLFHWIFWRWIRAYRSHQDISIAVATVLEANGLDFFFQSTISLWMGNTLRMKMLKTELEQLYREVQSGRSLLL